MKNLITIPVGKFADDEALKKKCEELKKKLLEGKKIPISPIGNVADDNDSGKGISIPAGKLANNDEAFKKKRDELKKKLLEGKKISISSTGNVAGGNDSGNGTFIPGGKLALKQWYEKDPGLLAAEKSAMAHAFPHFELENLDDGRIAWSGSLNIGVMGDNTWHIMAVYDNNHPKQVMGSSVRVYLVKPDIQELIQDLGWQPTHLLRDSSNQLYLCTAEADNIKIGDTITSAASVIAWAVKWLLAFELVLTGDLSQAKFNEHGGI